MTSHTCSPYSLKLRRQNARLLFNSILRAKNVQIFEDKTLTNELRMKICASFLKLGRDLLLFVNDAGNVGVSVQFCVSLELFRFGLLLDFYFS